MISMPILDVAIGLSFFYLLLGLICTTINEMIAGWRKTRARFLDKGIDRLLGSDPELKRKLYQHPLIKSLAPSDTEICPSYIPADKFATALLDVLSGQDKPLTDIRAVLDGVRALNNPMLQVALGAIVARAHDDAAELHDRIERWFNDGMDRVSGWYKRNAQLNSIILAVIVTLVFNADTVFVAHTLWTNPVLRSTVVEEAQTRAARQPPPENMPLVNYDDPSKPEASKFVPASPEEALSATERAMLADLTGWAPDRKKLTDAGYSARALAGVVWNHGLGWILTALAVSMGAPFWFDTLNRFMNIRNAGRAPDEKRAKNAPGSPDHPGSQPSQG